MKKLESTSMIRRNETHYELTEKGSEHLNSGIYESVPATEKRRYLYSPCHQELLGPERDFGTVDKKRVYRHLNEVLLAASSLAPEKVIEALGAEEAQTEANTHTFINQADAPKPLDSKFIQCFEFRLLNTEENRSFTRVWNTLLNQWDVQLEEQIKELEWRLNVHREDTAWTSPTTRI